MSLFHGFGAFGLIGGPLLWGIVSYVVLFCLCFVVANKRANNGVPPIPAKPDLSCFDASNASICMIFDQLPIFLTTNLSDRKIGMGSIYMAECG